MTGAAVGILVFEELVFDQLYHFFQSQESNQNYRAYGKWNKYIFLISVLSSAMAFIMSLGAYLKTRKNDGNKDKVSDFVNF
jgi:heme/copper-type cytochrome/quinol oxidase subunit 3